MTFFELHKAGNTEAQQKQAIAYLFDQASIGKAATGVLDGLAVAQTTSASTDVTVAAGAGVVQASAIAGASLVGLDTQATLDVLVANPMGGTPRNDIVVLDQATGSARVIVGTPSATPADPSVPTSAIPLARLAHAASATTVPTSAITDLRSFTTLSNSVTLPDQPYFASHGGVTTDVSGYITITHGAPFTPSGVVAWNMSPDTRYAQFWGATDITATTVKLRWGHATSTSLYASLDTGVFGYVCFP